jgi:HSP20 family protein
VPRRRDVDRLQEEIEELFSDLWQVPRFAGLRRGFRPSVDCFRTAEPPQLIVVVELAGVEPAAVRVDALPGELVIRGERRRQGHAGRVYQQMEIDHGPFERRIPLDGDVDTAAATATYRAGLLTIVLPLAARSARPVKVAIDVAEASP